MSASCAKATHLATYSMRSRCVTASSATRCAYADLRVTHTREESKRGGSTARGEAVRRRGFSTEFPPLL
eukprot:1294392-Pyramimonas_sp.AAC.1